MSTMTQAQIAKATKDHLDSQGHCKDLSAKQVWRIGYMYADVVSKYHGPCTRAQFEGLHFDCLSEAVEEFENERERYWASRQNW
jgi:hypothetical protein